MEMFNLFLSYFSDKEKEMLIDLLEEKHVTPSNKESYLDKVAAESHNGHIEQLVKYIQGTRI